MNLRELTLLSHYRLPARDPLTLGNEEIAAFLNAYSALWHPAALQLASGPPRVVSPYDHEKPSAGHIYAVPHPPPLVLPEGWEQHVRDADAFSFQATPERSTTLLNLRNALAAGPLTELDSATIAPFLAIGFGYAVLEALCEAMEHQNALVVADFWSNIQQAVATLAKGDSQAAREHLKQAAQQLQAAREVLYPVNIHLLDLGFMDAEEHLASPPSRSAPYNLIASGADLEKFDQSDLAIIREAVDAGRLEICGGCLVARDEALLPVESQLWNLRRGMETSKKLLGSDIHVFASKRFFAHPHTPGFLQQVGLQRTLLLPFDDGVVPSYHVTVISWPGPNGKQVDAFVRPPHPAESLQTYFHWAHYLRKTIAEDHSATLGIVHTGKSSPPWYDDLMELATLAPVFGKWTTFSSYFTDVLAGEYAPAGNPDDFHGDYLSERVQARSTAPVSGFAKHVRWRRRLDSVFTLSAMLRGLSATYDQQLLEERITALEDQMEETQDSAPGELAELEIQVARSLADRLQSRAEENNPGYMVLNPCSFSRRLALEIEAGPGEIAVAGPVKAAQTGDGHTRLVVEVPPLGFAWFPRPKDGIPPNATRMRLADKTAVRNEFFEAEIDPNTGGLRALRDPRTRTNRLGQQLVFNPGSSIRVKEVRVVSTGPALGEIVTEGAIVDGQEQVIALFRQRFRAWLGRPVLDLRFEIFPQRPVQGHPWHAYYGARFAWRDERATLLRGVNGTGYVSHATRPETPDFLEIRLGNRQNVLLLPCGLPFNQRHGGRMLDLILVTEGEQVQAFDVGVAIDRTHPWLMACGMVSPSTIVPTAKGPPHVGQSGWLFHLDASNLLLSSMRFESSGAGAVVARLQECSMNAGQAELRCPRKPTRAALVNALGESIQELTIAGDAVQFDAPSGDLLQVKLEFE